MINCRLLAIIIVAGACIAACSDLEYVDSGNAAGPKVILIIGDGMDDQQITIARNYLVGSYGKLAMDSMPYRGAVRVYGLSEEDPEQVTYVTDSAGTATAMATGVVTSSTRVGTTAKTNEEIVNIYELAVKSNIHTGIVTTASITDATPASFVAHINNRWCQGPDSMEGTFMRAPHLSYNCQSSAVSNGGRGSIAEQLAYSAVDIFLGGGSKHFEQAINGDNSVLDVAVERGYRVIRKANELDTLSGDSKVMGLFSADTMPVMLWGANDAKAQLLEKVDGRAIMPEPFSCEANPDFSGLPDLAGLTSAAIGHLDQFNSFMLMIESASIDKQSHARRPCGHIGELRQLDEALKLVLEYAKLHPETLVLVTADHGHVAQITSETSMFATQGYGSPGYFARVITPEGAIMGVNYASTDFPMIEGHSGAQVPLFASGPGIDSLPTFIDQAEIFEIAARHLGILGN